MWLAAAAVLIVLLGLAGSDSVLISQFAGEGAVAVLLAYWAWWQFKFKVLARGARWHDHAGAVVSAILLNGAVRYGLAFVLGGQWGLAPGVIGYLVLPIGVAGAFCALVVAVSRRSEARHGIAGPLDAKVVAVREPSQKAAQVHANAGDSLRLRNFGVGRIVLIGLGVALCFGFLRYIGHSPSQLVARVIAPEPGKSSGLLDDVLRPNKEEKPPWEENYATTHSEARPENQQPQVVQTTPPAPARNDAGEEYLEQSWQTVTDAQFNAGVNAWFEKHPEYNNEHDKAAINSHFQEVTKLYPQAALGRAVDMALDRSKKAGQSLYNQQHEQPHESSAIASRGCISNGSVSPPGRYIGSHVTFNFEKVPLRTLLQLLAEESGLSFKASADVNGDIAACGIDVPWDFALDRVLSTHGFAYRQVGTTIHIFKRQ